MSKQKELDVAYTVYTEELFDLCYPYASEEERFYFFMVTEAEKVMKLEQKFNRPIRYVRRVVLDDEYLQWLHERKLANTEQSRSLYAEHISGEKAEELWVKHEFHQEILPLLLPVVVASTDYAIPANEIKIKKQLLPSLRAHVAATYRVKANQVWVHPALTRADVWDEIEECRLYEHLFDYFNEVKTDYETPKTLVAQKDINIDLRFIPVAISQITPANTTAKTLKDEWEPRLLNKSCEQLSKKFGYSFEVNLQPYAIAIDEAFDARQDFIGFLQEDAKEYGIPFMVK